MLISYGITSSLLYTPDRSRVNLHPSFSCMEAYTIIAGTIQLKATCIIVQYVLMLLVVLVETMCIIISDSQLRTCSGCELKGILKLYRKFYSVILLYPDGDECMHDL